MSPALLVDTNVLVALSDAGDRNHEPARRLLTSTSSRLLVTSTVIAEVGYFRDEYAGPVAEASFLASFVPVGPPEWRGSESWRRACGPVR